MIADPNRNAYFIWVGNRKEELYIPFLQYIVNCDVLDELDKIRPRYQLEMVLKNRPNEIAANFAYTLLNDTIGDL